MRIVVGLILGALAGGLVTHGVHERDREVEINTANAIITAYELKHLSEALDDRGNLACRISSRADHLYRELGNLDWAMIRAPMTGHDGPADFARESVARALEAYQSGKASKYAERCR